MSTETYATTHSLPRRLQRVIDICFIAVIAWPIMAFGVSPSTIFRLIVPVTVFLIVRAFRALSIRVTNDEVNVAFAYGCPRRRIPLNDIAEVSIVRMRAIYGWGIRLVPRGTLWRAAGFKTVRLELVSGRSVYIGAKNCEELAQQISERRNNSRS